MEVLRQGLVHFKVLLLMILVGMLDACTDHAYDFDRTNQDVTLLGDDVSIPLGQIGPLTIQSLLGEKMADYLVSLEDGTFAIQYKSNPVNFVFDELRNIDGAAPFQRFCDFPIGYDFSLFSKPGGIPFDDRGEADLSAYIPSQVKFENLSRSLDVSVSGLPVQLASLQSITLSQKSRVEITVSIPDCLLTEGTVTPDLTFDMGSFFTSDDFPGGKIKINSPLNSANGYSATTSIPLNKFSLDPKSFNPADHTLSVSASLKFSGSCSVSGPRTNRERYAKAPQNLKFHVNVIMREIACKEIEGAFDYARRQQVVFPMGDFVSELTDKLSEDSRFDFADPTLLMDIESNISIPISAQLELNARQKGVSYAGVKGIPIVFPVAEPGTFARKRYRIAKQPVHNPGEDPIAIDFTSLLSRIPDDLLITANAATQPDKTAVLRIGENYQVRISPQIIIPLSFGPATKLSIHKTIALPEQLGAMIQKNPFNVLGQIDNGFPLKFGFSLVMVDKEGIALTETIHQSLAAGTSNEIAFSLTGLPGADLSQLASAILIFEAEGIPESQPVTMDNAISADLHIVIPGGIHLSI